MAMSDQELVKHLKTLLFQPGFKLTTLNNIVHNLESQLGCDLSHRSSFIGEQVNEIIASVYPVYPADHFTLQSRFHSQDGEIKGSVLTKSNHSVNPEQQMVFKAGSDSQDAETKGSDAAKRNQFVNPTQQMVFKAGSDSQDAETKGSDAAKRYQFVNPTQQMVYKAKATSQAAEIEGSDVEKRNHYVNLQQQMVFKAGVDSQDAETKGSDAAKRNQFVNPTQKMVNKAEADLKAAEIEGSDVGKSVPTKKRGRAGGINKVCGVTPELQVIVGQPALPRTEIVKQLWAYIRRNELQDPTDKRKIICDDALRAVFDTDATDIFKMNKFLSKHIIRLEPPKQEEASNQAKKMKEGSVDSSSD